ncbi:hypothetical protein SCP_1004210 [Sparassis crispa]|uniref:Uncharacterized protein n=1 Tax=Sparassis crispa TaxID=139825 RepID=A0A401GYJ4_9APHY|nr:hypothetical protein SCP_1004210 [Sparassis crispa]GBE87174.1 hypothetical protein SCP_1004210 [Sparassis crispa]
MLANSPTSAMVEGAPTLPGLTPVQFQRWKPAISACNLDSALGYLGREGVRLSWAATPTNDMPHLSPVPLQPPTWVILYLICHQVTSPADAKKALVLAYYHLPTALPHLRPCLLIFSACWLAEHNLVVPLQDLIRRLLQSSCEWREYDYSAFLKLVAAASASPTGIRLIIPVLEASSARRLRLDQDTFDSLLSGQFATAELGIALARSMQSQATIPSVKNLERLVKLFAKAGWRKRAGRCLDLVRHHYAEQQTETVPFGTNPYARNVMQAPTLSQHWYMSAFGSVRSLHAYMQACGVHSRLWRAEPRIGTWRSVLRAAVRDRSLSAKSLLAILERAKASDSSLRLDVVSDLVTINGLLHRRDNTNAARIWDTIAAKKDRLEVWGLALGVKALTLAGRPSEAFALLRGIDTSRYSATSTQLLSRSEARQQITTHTINIFMASLQRIGRPDIVFELWDYMESLFGISPDQFTMAIVLKTARFASKSDQSVRGALADIGLGNFFRRKSVGDAPVSYPESSRSMAVARIQELLAQNRNDTNSGVWRGERAGVQALQVAHHILLGNWPELHTIQSPVHAVRRSLGFSPVGGLFRALSGRPSTPSQDDSRAAQQAPNYDIDSLWPYPQVLPNDVAFRAYIDLLGAENQMSEIPLALAWMRHLDVKPSRNTLATALVYWAEVSMDSPLVEHWKSERSEYLRLIRWMKEWVGSENLPTDADIGLHLGRIKWFRDLRYGRRPVHS